MNVTVNSEAAMRRIGEQLGSALQGGECIELIGDVGAGKTTLTKGIAAGLKIEETVQSPTFTINRVYNAPNGVRLSHYDFYRLQDPGIMAAELEESTADPAVAVVIEWGDVVASVIPNDHLSVRIESPTETSRSVVLTANGTRSTALLRGLE